MQQQQATSDGEDSRAARNLDPAPCGWHSAGSCDCDPAQEPAAVPPRQDLGAGSARPAACTLLATGTCTCDPAAAGCRSGTCTCSDGEDDGCYTVVQVPAPVTRGQDRVAQPDISDRWYPR